MEDKLEQIVEFECDGGSASLFDEVADEIIWSMDLAYSDDVEKKLYELLTLMTDKKKPYMIIFPGVGRITSNKCPDCQAKNKEIEQLVELVTNLRNKLTDTRGEKKTDKRWMAGDWRTQ